MKFGLFVQFLENISLLTFTDFLLSWPLLIFWWHRGYIWRSSLSCLLVLHAFVVGEKNLYTAYFKHNMTDYWYRILYFNLGMSRKKMFAAHKARLVICRLKRRHIVPASLAIAFLIGIYGYFLLLIQLSIYNCLVTRSHVHLACWRQ